MNTITQSLKAMWWAIRLPLRIVDHLVGRLAFGLAIGLVIAGWLVVSLMADYIAVRLVVAANAAAVDYWIEALPEMLGSGGYNHPAPEMAVFVTYSVTETVAPSIKWEPTLWVLVVWLAFQAYLIALTFDLGARIVRRRYRARSN